jgi:hypothetical protein
MIADKLDDGTTICKGGWPQIMAECQVVPGRVIIVRATIELQLSSGLLLPPTNPNLKGSFDRMHHGVVIGCGLYADHQGVPREVPGWPLSAGTYIEYFRPEPWQGMDKTFQVNCEDIRRTWKPGHPPSWWPEHMRYNWPVEAQKWR